MFKVGDEVKVIASKKDLDSIGLDGSERGWIGKVEEIDGTSFWISSTCPIVVKFKAGTFDFRESDLELVGSKKETKKETNPKDSVGIKKVPVSTIPTQPMLEVGLAMMEGARKYGRHNYRKAGVRASVYYDAAIRHLTSWWEGEDIDPDSGLPHVIKAAACLFVLRDSQIMENWVDDRPPQYPGKLNVKSLNEAATKIIEKYPDSVPAFVAKETI